MLSCARAISAMVCSYIRATQCFHLLPARYPEQRAADPALYFSDAPHLEFNFGI